MKKITYQDIAPYLRKSRVFDLKRLDKIEIFIRENLRFQYFKITDGEWDIAGSCSTFRFYFDKNWLSTEHKLEGSGLSHYSVVIGVSARGPFITGIGFEQQPVQPGRFQLPNGNGTEFVLSKDAQTKAEEISLKIAKEFDLIYLDPTWLSKYEIDVMDLASDANLSLDTANPTALNVLFSEYL